ncbi:hypothetical protein ACH4JS_31425 [Streptomyces sp. NPDC017638]|uniref:hypothetical protein n=1 Tax=Streptomyces sp. NPDC017638 TaxID=3365004 RepID=UPI00379F7232
MPNTSTRAALRAALTMPFIAAQAMALGPSAHAEPAPQAAPGMYCGDWHHLYSKNGWVYADIQGCVEVEGDGNALYTLHTHNVTYYWGGAWYPASSENEGYANSKANLYKDGVKIYSYNGLEFNQYARNSTGRAAAWGPGHGADKLSSCGEYNLEYTYNQIGPYWKDDDSMILAGPFNETITVACGSS